MEKESNPSFIRNNTNSGFKAKVVGLLSKINLDKGMKPINQINTWEDDQNNRFETLKDESKDNRLMTMDNVGENDLALDKLSLEPDNTNMPNSNLTVSNESTIKDNDSSTNPQPMIYKPPPRSQSKRKEFCEKNLNVDPKPTTKPSRGCVTPMRLDLESRNIDDESFISKYNDTKNISNITNNTTREYSTRTFNAKDRKKGLISSKNVEHVDVVNKDIPIEKKHNSNDFNVVYNEFSDTNNNEPKYINNRIDNNNIHHRSIRSNTILEGNIKPSLGNNFYNFNNNLLNETMDSNVHKRDNNTIPINNNLLLNNNSIGLSNNMSMNSNNNFGFVENTIPENNYFGYNNNNNPNNNFNFMTNSNTPNLMNNSNFTTNNNSSNIIHNTSNLNKYQDNCNIPYYGNPNLNNKNTMYNQPSKNNFLNSNNLINNNNNNNVSNIYGRSNDGPIKPNYNTNNIMNKSSTGNYNNINNNINNIPESISINNNISNNTISGNYSNYNPYNNVNNDNFNNSMNNMYNNNNINSTNYDYNNPRSPSNSPIINLEDLLFLEEKLNDIIIKVINNQIMHFECFEFWNFYFNCSLNGEFEVFFKDKVSKQIIKDRSILELLTVIICYNTSFNDQLYFAIVHILKSCLHFIHQNFLVVCDYILSKVSSESQTNIWVQKLDSILNYKLSKKIDYNEHVQEIKNLNITIYDYLRLILKNSPDDEINRSMVNFFKNVSKLNVYVLHDFFKSKVLRVQVSTY